MKILTMRVLKTDMICIQQLQKSNDDEQTSNPNREWPTRQSPHTENLQTVSSANY